MGAFGLYDTAAEAGRMYAEAPEMGVYVDAAPEIAGANVEVGGTWVAPAVEMGAHVVAPDKMGAWEVGTVEMGAQVVGTVEMGAWVVGAVERGM